MNKTIVKSDAVKVRQLLDGQVITGFAGGSADAFSLLERLRASCRTIPRNLPRAATELAKDGAAIELSGDSEALLIAVDRHHSLLVSGTGDVIQASDGILAIGSGGNYAISAARALVRHSSLSSEKSSRTAWQSPAN